MLVSNDLVARMKPGSVLVDIAIDQGGCFEDSRPTTHADPVYKVHESVFYCVANMPGAVPHTSTYALTNVTLPYAAGDRRPGVARRAAGRPGAGPGAQHPRRAGHLPLGGRGPRAAGVAGASWPDGLGRRPERWAYGEDWASSRSRPRVTGQVGCGSAGGLRRPHRRNLPRWPEPSARTWNKWPPGVRTDGLQASARPTPNRTLEHLDGAALGRPSASAPQVRGRRRRSASQLTARFMERHRPGLISVHGPRWSRAITRSPSSRMTGHAMVRRPLSAVTSTGPRRVAGRYRGAHAPWASPAVSVREVDGRRRPGRARGGVVDADTISREILEPGGAAYRPVVDRFGRASSGPTAASTGRPWRRGVRRRRRPGRPQPAHPSGHRPRSWPSGSTPAAPESRRRGPRHRRCSSIVTTDRFHSDAIVVVDTPRRWRWPAWSTTGVSPRTTPGPGWRPRSAGRSGAACADLVIDNSGDRGRPRGRDRPGLGAGWQDRAGRRPPE